MSLTIVQTATGTASGSIPGGDLGPGTVAMLNCTATFPGAVTSGNLIAVFAVARVVAAGNQVQQAAISPPREVGTTSGGSHPARTVNVQVSYLSSTGLESALTDLSDLPVSASNRVTVSHQNPFLSVLPGCQGWHVYLDGVLSGSLLPTENFTEDTGTGSGPAPGPIANIEDTASNAYAQYLWTDSRGEAQGSEMMSCFVATAGSAATPTITFSCVGFNPNSALDQSYDVCLIACEISGLPSLATGGSASTQQGAGVGDLQVSLIAPGFGVVTDFGSQSQSAASVIDIVSGTDHYLFAIGTGSYSGTTPTVSTSGALSPVANTSSTGGLPLYVFAGGPIQPMIEDWLVVNEPPSGSPATGGGFTKRGSYLHTGDGGQHSFVLQMRQRGSANYTLIVGRTDPYEPTIGEPIYLWDQNAAGYTLVFSGILQDYTNRWIGIEGDRYIDCTATSLEAVFDTVYATPMQFVNQTCGAIVAALYSAFETGCPVALGTVQAGATIPLFVTDYQKLSDLFDQLATTSGFTWGVNPQTSQLYFCAPTTTAAPFTLASTEVLWDTLNEKFDGADYRNRQAVRLSYDAFPHSMEFFIGAGQTQITLARPVKQVTNAWATLSTPNTATGTFSGNPSAGDTINIGPANGAWQALNIYGLGGVIVVNGFVFAVTTAGTSGSSIPNFSAADITGDTVIDATVIWTCNGALGLSTGQDTYTFVASLDNTQFGQVLIGASSSDTCQNLVDCINANAAVRGTTFSLPTWECSQANAVNNTGLSFTLQQKPAGTGYVASISASSSAFAWSAAQTSGGTSPQGSLGPNEGATISLQVYAAGTSVAAPGLSYTEGSAVINLATPLNAGSNLNIEYTRADGDIIEVQNDSQVTAMAALTHGTGKYQQVTDASTQGLISTSAATGLQFAQEALAAYDSFPTEIELQLFQPGLLPGQELIVALSGALGAAINGTYYIEEVRAELIPTWPYIDSIPVPGGGHYKYTIRLINVAQIASYMDFWEQMGGGGAGGGQGSALVATSGGALTTVGQTILLGKYKTSWTGQTSVTVTHNLGTTDLIFQVFDSSGNPGQAETSTFTSSNVLTLTFGASFTGRIVVIG